MSKIGILAFQGDFLEHKEAVESFQKEVVLVRSQKDLQNINYLILPGGESTVIGRFLKESGLDKQIIDRVKNLKNLSVYGTCAGAILLCTEVISKKPINNLNLIEAKISRNSYGSQVHSFSQKIEFLPSKKSLEAIFIRAPKILDFNKDKVQVLAKYQKETLEEILILQQENVLISTFHPELIRPATIHDYFLNKM